MILKFEVKDTKYFNIKELLKSHFRISDRLLIKLKSNNRIFLNNKLTYVNTKLSIGDVIIVNMNFDETSDNIVPTKMNLNILYEDEHMLIINKPSNLIIHLSSNHYSDTLSNGVKFYFDSIGLKRKIRPVNRLDRDTTGIVIFAKSEYIQECLIKQMKTKDFVKKYIAILDGYLEEAKGTIQVPIARKPNSIIEREISSNSETAITHFEVIKYLDNQSFTMVKFILETGRTHQIRVHSKYIGHSIIGDTLYGKSSNLINRQALHSYKIEFIHPISKEYIIIETELPNDMESIINFNKK